MVGFDVVCAPGAGRILCGRGAHLSPCQGFQLAVRDEVRPQVANFRILSRKVIDSYNSMGERLRFFGGHLEWLGFEAGYVNVEHGARVGGESSYTFRKLVSLALNTIIAYSDKPLRMSVKAGFAMALLSLLYAVWLGFRKLALDIPVEGWTSLMVSLWFRG